MDGSKPHEDTEVINNQPVKIRHCKKLGLPKPNQKQQSESKTQTPLPGEKLIKSRKYKDCQVDNGSHPCTLFYF